MWNSIFEAVATHPLPAGLMALVVGGLFLLYQDRTARR